MPPSTASSPETDARNAANVTTPLPEAVRAELESIGVNGDTLLQLRTDLDESGHFGQRFLVATPARVVVVSNNGHAQIERDIAFSEVGAIAARSFSGVSSLEFRLRNNNGEVVEVLRGTSARARELTRAAHQLEELRHKGEITPVSETEYKSWKSRQCPKCNKPLPGTSRVCAFCADRLGALKRIYGYLAPYKKLAWTSGLLNVLSVGLEFVAPILTKVLIDRVFPPAIQQGASAAVQAAQSGESRWILAGLIGAIVVSSGISGVMGLVRGRIAGYLGAHVLHDIRSQLYSHLQLLSVSYYDKSEVGAVMSRIQNDVNTLQNFLLDIAEATIIALLTIACVLIIMFYYAPVLALLVMLPVPFVVIGTQSYWRGLMRLWRRVRHQNAVLSARLADALGGVRVVRAFGAEEREINQFQTRSGALRDATMEVEVRAAQFYPIIGFVMGLGLPIIWLFGGFQVLNGNVEFGTLFLFTILLARLYGPIQQLTRQVNAITRAMTSAERIFEVMDTDPEIADRPQPVHMPEPRGEVDFRGVSFGYERTRPVLQRVDLHVAPGEMIGLVGHSGAGKSTLINLLLRFYDVTEGAITIDGVDIRDIALEDLRRHVGVVLQESYLFHGSIYSNIAYGNPSASPEAVMSAAKAAHAHDFIVNFPDGYDTLVGERGTRLSGGERQRIAIARAILHDPKILILDEATASVDTQTESAIQGALTNLVKGRTTFAIAHRLSTLKHADRLVVIEHGKIAEIGTHDELMRRRGTFYRLVQAQQAMNEIVTVGG